MVLKSKGKDLGMKVICENCGATFDANESKCPYCGHTYVPAAEKEYMGDMKQMKDDLESLKNSPQKEMLNEAKKSGVSALKILIGIGILVLIISLPAIFERSTSSGRSKREFSQKTKYYAILDDYYDKQDYDGMSEAYYELDSKERIGLSGYKHYELIQVIKTYNDVQDELKDFDGVNDSRYKKQRLVQEEFEVMIAPVIKEIPKADVALVEERAKRIREDFKSRFHFTEEELDSFLNEHKESSYLDSDVADEVAKRLDA